MTTDKIIPRYQAHENIPYGWEIIDFDAVPPRTFVVGLTQESADRIVAELRKLCSDIVGVEVISEVMLADCRRQAQKMVEHANSLWLNVFGQFGSTPEECGIAVTLKFEQYDDQLIVMEARVEDLERQLRSNS